MVYCDLQMTSKILNFIIDGNLSFNVAQLPSLRDLLESVSGRRIKIPSRHKFMATLGSEFKSMKTALKDTLSKQKYLCITADVWSSRAQSYLGATVHFLNANYIRESYVLGFKYMSGRQTYKELARAMNEILQDFDIKKSQVTHIVTDGGSAFCKMFKMYGQEIDATVVITDNEDIETEIETIVNQTTNDIIQPFMEDQNGETCVSEILNFNLEEELSPPDNVPDKNYDEYFEGVNEVPSAIKIDLPPQRRCVSHLLNLVSDDFEKNLSGMAKTALIAAFNKLHSVWVLTHRSSKSKDLCKQVLGKLLLVPCATRWNSKFDAVKRCVEPTIKGKLNELIERLQTEVIELYSTSNRRLCLITAHDEAVIQQYINVFEPVAKSLDMMQSEFNGSQGLIIPVLVTMKHRILQIEENSNVARDFKSTMLHVISSRFSNYFKFNELNKDLILASLTLPRIKTSFISQDDNLIYAKSLLVSECKKLNEDKNEQVVEELLLRDEDDFFISFASSQNVRRNSIENHIESQVSRYLCDQRKDIKILDEYPNVRAVYFKHNTTLSSSAPVERVFSQSLMIFTPRRNRLSAEHFEQALLLKHNRLLIEKSKEGK